MIVVDGIRLFDCATGAYFGSSFLLWTGCLHQVLDTTFWLLRCWPWCLLSLQHFLDFFHRRHVIPFFFRPASIMCGLHSVINLTTYCVLVLSTSTDFVCKFYWYADRPNLTHLPFQKKFPITVLFVFAT